MKPESISIDQFLQQEEAKGEDFLAFLEKDPENAEHVRITPWNGEGCSCSSSLSVSRKLIASVEPTVNTHRCCGGSHTVVKVNFTECAAIPVTDVFSQLVHAGTSMEAMRRKGIMPDAAPFWPMQDEHPEEVSHYRDSIPSRNPYCRWKGYKWHLCPPIVDPSSGKIIRPGEWKLVPHYVSWITGKPCALPTDPCA